MRVLRAQVRLLLQFGIFLAKSPLVRKILSFGIAPLMDMSVIPLPRNSGNCKMQKNRIVAEPTQAEPMY